MVPQRGNDLLILSYFWFFDRRKCLDLDSIFGILFPIEFDDRYLDRRANNINILLLLGMKDALGPSKLSGMISHDYLLYPCIDLQDIQIFV